MPPAEVAAELTRLFPWNATTEQYFTLLYGILSLDTPQFRFVSAGHPGPVQLSKNGGATLHKAAGLPIGIGEAAYRQDGTSAHPRVKLAVFDGDHDIWVIITDAGDVASMAITAEREARELLSAIR